MLQQEERNIHLITPHRRLGRERQRKERWQSTFGSLNGHCANHTHAMGMVLSALAVDYAGYFGAHNVPIRGEGGGGGYPFGRNQGGRGQHGENSQQV